LKAWNLGLILRFKTQKGEEKEREKKSTSNEWIDGDPVLGRRNSFGRKNSTGRKKRGGPILEASRNGEIGRLRGGGQLQRKMEGPAGQKKKNKRFLESWIKNRHNP